MRLIEKLEQVKVLDRVSQPVLELTRRLVEPRAVRNLLSGTNLGHPLHPMLTDVPIGAWSMAAVLDVLGGEDSHRAADGLVGVGILAAVPTAASGLNDWSDTYGGETRLGVVHAAANAAALTLYATSLVARVFGRRRLGRRLGLAGLGLVVGGGYLGGHLAYAKGVNVNHTAFEARPTDWTPVLADAELREGVPTLARAGDATVVLVRHTGRLHALADTCSHMGGPLHDGKLVDGCLACPWHGSQFRLDSGRVHRGPASSPQPVYETRVVNGTIEVRGTGH